MLIHLHGMIMQILKIAFWNFNKIHSIKKPVSTHIETGFFCLLKELSSTDNHTIGLNLPGKHLKRKRFLNQTIIQTKKYVY